MTRLFEANTRIEAWTQAAEWLVEAGPQFNVILSIHSPSSDGPHTTPIRASIDEFLKKEEKYPIHTVAETIFPGWEYKHHGIKGVYEWYPNEEFPILERGDKKSWGTYAHRILRRGTADGKTINPLEVLIEKMKDERSKPGPKRSCYEIGIAEPEYEIPLYNWRKDQKLRMGLPCLSHLSLKLDDDRVHLTAIYRSHDYRYKVVGNLLGLARLQACVAKQIGGVVGTMVVHSTYAYLKGNKGIVRDLLSHIRELQTVGV